MPRRVDTPAGAPRGLHGGPALMDRLQTHAWQLLALLLAALLVWQSLARLGAERDAAQARTDLATDRDRKSTRLNSSHSQISYAVFCLKKKKKNYERVHNKHIPPTIKYTRPSEKYKQQASSRPITT